MLEVTANEADVSAEYAFQSSCTLAGDTEFYFPEKPFGQFDKNSITNLSAVYHDFEDTNEFITDTEKFDWIKRYRI